MSAAYGKFLAVERQGFCPSHVDLPPARPRELARIVAPGANHAYDVIARVGIARFLHCRQSEEIRMELSAAHGIDMPTRTIRYLARKFVAYFDVVHRESIGLLRGEMQRRGGYILHVDGTCEEGSGVLLVCLDSLSGQVLESRKIGSENHEEVQHVLEGVREDWGRPLAVVHDLRRALITATAEVFKGVPQFVCHFHLAADVGKDILKSHEDRLRRLFRGSKVRPKLRALIRSLKEFAVSAQDGEHRMSSLLELRSDNKLRERSTAEDVKAAVHGLASWILAYRQDGEGYGFPFDMPYLNLYQRVVKVHEALAKLRCGPKRRRGALGHLDRLREILDAVVASDETSEFEEAVEATKRDLRIFTRFRTALRICPKQGVKRRNDTGAPGTMSAKSHQAILQKLRESLRRQAHRGNSSARACEIVVQHLDKYWSYLFGHALPKRKGSKAIVVPRTNNPEEYFFGIVKRQCRRLHGRGHLTHDLQSMLPATPLVLNLNNTGYCETVYGGNEFERIAERFSAVDPKMPAEVMHTWKSDRLSTAMPRKLEKLMSLPKRTARFLGIAARELKA